MMTSEPALVAGLAYLVGMTFGLYLGERGRRKDAQRREGVLIVDEPQRAEVLAPDGGGELRDAPARWIQETMDETGCSEAEARAEWRRVYAASFGDGHAGWVDELP